MGDACVLGGSKEGYVRALAEVPHFYCSLVDTREHSGGRERPRDVRHTALQHTALRQTHTALQHTALRQTHTTLQHTALRQTHTTLQHTALRQTHTALQHRGTMSDTQHVTTSDIHSISLYSQDRHGMIL